MWPRLQYGPYAAAMTTAGEVINDLQAMGICAHAAFHIRRGVHIRLAGFQSKGPRHK
jgi:hypothetical protein